MKGERADARGVRGSEWDSMLHMNVFEPGTDRLNVFTRRPRRM